VQVVVSVALGVVVVTVAAAVAAEAWARTRGLARAADQLAAQVGTTDLELTVPERPLLPVLLRGPGTSAELVARDVPVGDRGGHVRELRAHVVDVRVDPRRRTLVLGEGTFTATIGQEDLGRVVQLPGVVDRLELRRAGLRVWTVLAVPVDAEVLVIDGGLTILPDPLQIDGLLALPGLSAFRRTLENASLRLPLPVLPLDGRILDLVFDDGEVVVSGSSAGRSLPWSGAPDGPDGPHTAPGTPRDRTPGAS
jgi:hypothetical protein